MSESVYFRLSERLQRGIASAFPSWNDLHPVQKLTIEAVFAGKNAVVLAPTAGGKTEAAFFPILDQLHRDFDRQGGDSVGCIYVSPLRALLNNQEGRVQQLAKLVGLDAFKWHGDVGASDRKRFLKNPANILMTTPESLEVMLMSGQSEKHKLFDHVRFVVIDEIHAFAADDRGAHLMALLERIQNSSDADVQRIGLSATVGNPEDIASWMQGSSKRERTVVDPPREPVQRKINIRYTGGESEEAASFAVPVTRGHKSIFFTQSRADAERIRQAFSRQGVEVFVHHSSVSRDRREEAERQFMETEGAATIVSTSTLELGIDVGDLDMVLQFDAPPTVSSFLQRMGRTGRREGAPSHIEFFTSREDSLLQAVALINLARRKFIEKVEPSPANLPVFLHQILARVVERNGVRRDALWRDLEGPAPFSRIDRDTFDRIIDHLLKTKVLDLSDHRLVFGEQGERVFGRMNFFDLYSVFETPSEVVVKTRDGRVIGTLQSLFVWRMKDTEFTFLLASRTWRAVDVDLSKGVVVAIPFHSAEAPKWHGAGGSLSREVSEEMRNILLSDQEFPFVDGAGREEIQGMRERMQPLLSRDRCPVAVENARITVHTYAGGRINATISAILEADGGLEVRDFGDLEISLGHPLGSRVGAGFVRKALLDLRDADKRLGQSDLAHLVSDKQRGKLAKFQPYLPPDLEGAYLADKLFDVHGASELARKSEFEVV